MKRQPKRVSVRLTGLKICLQAGFLFVDESFYGFSFRCA